MFVIQLTGGETIQESQALTWDDVPGGIASLQLVHPVLNISVGLHSCQRYAFMCEGVSSIQQRVDIPRIAENIYGRRDGMYIHLRLHQSGRIEAKLLDAAPAIAEHAWRE